MSNTSKRAILAYTCINLPKKGYRAKLGHPYLDLLFMNEQKTKIQLDRRQSKAVGCIFLKYFLLKKSTSTLNYVATIKTMDGSYYTKKPLLKNTTHVSI